MSTERPTYWVGFTEADKAVEIRLDGQLVAVRSGVTSTVEADAALAQLGWRRFGRWRSTDGARSWFGSAVQVV